MKDWKDSINPPLEICKTTSGCDLLDKQNEDCERWIIQHDTSVGQGKYLSPRQESNPWPHEHMAGALSIELRELMESKAI